MISKCERCRHYDWKRMQMIIDAFRDSGIPRPRHIWCAAKNRPEDIREVFCDTFEPYETVVRVREGKSKPRYCNASGKLSKALKNGPRKA